jgi:hypothetical protein
MPLANTCTQIFIGIFFILLTIFFDGKFLRKLKTIKPILEELSEWRNSKKSFIDFKTFQYQQVFWQSAFQLTFTIFMAGILFLTKETITSIIGFYPWLICVAGSLYPLVKFSLVIIPASTRNFIENMKILLESKGK